jgi:glycosyltransferase involved in cell wall biosynthesis
MSHQRPISIVILTLNEEQNLPACLASTAGCDDVVVLDSGSTDRTVEIARAAGARVFVNPFKNFAQQRNHAHNVIAFRHEWVFHLDADEKLSPELIAECSACATSPAAAQLDGFYAAPRMFFHGRWIPRCTDYPAWQARFVNTRRFRFIEVGHGQREAPGMRLGRLTHPYDHNLSSQSDAEIRVKHARYAKTEAAATAGKAAAEAAALAASILDVIGFTDFVEPHSFSPSRRERGYLSFRSGSSPPPARSMSRVHARWRSFARRARRSRQASAFCEGWRRR